MTELKKILVVDDDFDFYEHLNRRLRNLYQIHWLPTVNGMVELHNTGEFCLTIVDSLGISLDGHDHHIEKLKYMFIKTSSVEPFRDVPDNFIVKDDLVEWIHGQAF